MRDAWVPLLFIEELRAAVEGFNLQRKANGMAPLEIECFLALNDEDPDALGLLKSHAEPLIAAARAEVPKLGKSDISRSLFMHTHGDYPKSRYAGAHAFWRRAAQGQYDRRGRYVTDEAPTKCFSIFFAKEKPKIGD
jgi:hypothetical protein